MTLWIYIYKCKTYHLVLCRLHFTAECKIGDPEQNRAVLDHTGSQAVLLHCTPSTLWLQLLCPVSHVHVCVCVCSSVCVAPARGLSDRSCPYLYAGLRGEADLSLLKPLQRERGRAVEVYGVQGRSARLLPPWALGAGELGLELRLGCGGLGFMWVARGQRQEAWEWGMLLYRKAGSWASYVCVCVCTLVSHWSEYVVHVCVIQSAVRVQFDGTVGPVGTTVIWDVPEGETDYGAQTPRSTITGAPDEITQAS